MDNIPVIPRDAIVFEEDEKRKAMYPPDFMEYWEVVKKEMYAEIDKRFMPAEGERDPDMALRMAGQVEVMKGVAAASWWDCKQTFNIDEHGIQTKVPEELADDNATG